MNVVEHLLTLKQRAKNENCLFMPYLNKVWCKGEKQVYQALISNLSNSINNCIFLNKNTKKGFSQIMYPVNRGIARHQYVNILIVDNYYKNKETAMDIISDAIDNTIDYWDVNLPPQVSHITLNIDGNDIGKCQKIEIASNADKITFNMLNVFMPDLYEVMNKIKYNNLKIALKGEPYSMSFIVQHPILISVDKLLGFENFVIETSINDYHIE